MIKHTVKRLRTFIYTALCLTNVKQHGEGVRINNRSSFTKTTIIGTNCHFNGMTITGRGNVCIGDNLHSGKRISIITSFHNYDSGTTIPYDETLITKDVIIDNNVWLGQDVIILGGVHIGEGSIIQAGSVVCSDIPPLAIAGGHPAAPFKYRDKDHYFQLKNQNRFF